MQSKIRVFLDSAPAIRIRHGVVHFLDTGLGTDSEHTMSVATALENHARLGRALERYAAGERDIYEGD